MLVLAPPAHRGNSDPVATHGTEQWHLAKHVQKILSDRLDQHLGVTVLVEPDQARCCGVAPVSEDLAG